MEELRVSRLKLERLSRGWTIEQVANMIGASKSALVTWEQEKQTPAVTMAIRLAKLYKTDVAELFSANRNNKKS